MTGENVEEQTTKEAPVQEQMSPAEEKAIKEDMAVFAEVEIAGIKVKPWSFGTLFDISPYLDIVLQKAEVNGLIKDLEELENKLPLHVIAKLFTTASDETLSILSLSTGVDPEKLKALSMQDGMAIVAAVFNQNKETIKNALAPLFRLVQ